MAETRKGTRRSAKETAQEITEQLNNTEVNLGEGVRTAALTGLAVALINKELLPGLAIGAGAVLLPKLLPIVGGLLRPVVKTAVWAGYATVASTREIIAEASEEFQDMVAEARAEREGGPAERASNARRRAA